MATEEVDKAVLKKYEVAQKLGKGAYGIVWKAYDKKTKDVVALKKIFDAFQNATDAQRTYREVVFLNQMGAHENIVMLHHVFKAENERDLYLVFEYMETDLHAVIRANILEEIHKQYIMYQAFKALMYMHSAQLVHRDMKPSNLLLNSECLMKVADFGLARSLITTDSEPSKKEGPHTQLPNNPYYIDGNPMMTDYVATRWYRAPEILVGSLTYDTPVDLWSLGCIFGEMLGGKPVFPGSSTLNQIEKIGEAVGPPSGEDVESLQSTYVYKMLDDMMFPEVEPSKDGKRRSLLFNSKCMPHPRPSKGYPKGFELSNQQWEPWDEPKMEGDGKTPLQVTQCHDMATQREMWRGHYPKSSDDAVDLLLQLMQYNPTKRKTAKEGLEHNYCAQFHDPESEVSYATKDGKNTVSISHHDNKKLNVQKYRDYLYGVDKKA